MTQAGWYPDPQQPGTEAYWDGQQWTTQRRPVPPPGPWTAPPPGATTPYGGQPPVEPYQPQPYQPTQQWPVPGGDWTAPGAPQPGQPGQPWGGPPPTTPPRRRRRALIAAAAVVVLAAAGVGTWLLWPGDDAPSYTYHGTAIGAPDKVLTQAEATVTALVKSRHGTQSADTRCYFDLPTAPPKGAPKSDVDSSLRCGPVLFVDGDTSKEYLPVPLSATAPAGGKVTVTPTEQLAGVDPVAVPATAKLSRPDGKSAPSGAGGLKAPAPPAAAADALVTASLGPVAAPASLGNAKLVGLDTTVQVSAAGAVPRYGAGDDARSAPAGHQLVAFQVDYSGGDVDDTGQAKAQLIVGTGRPRPVPATLGGNQWVVVAVPTGSTATLQLTNGGYTQTLTLPAGTAGAKNIGVLTRKNRTDAINKNVTVSVGLSEGGNSGSVSWQAVVKGASLDFWVPNHTDTHPTDPTHAMLSLQANYHYADKPGTDYGFDPALVQLKLPNGTVVAARNIARSGYVFNVFEVPATFTTGTLQITGSTKVDGVTVSISSPVSIPLSFPAG